MSQNAPNSDNYTLGRGVLAFQREDWPGELDLGNAPDVTFNVDITKLDHFSSRSGLRAKDKTVVSELVPAINFTLDEVNDDNIEMAFMCTVRNVTQAANDNIAATVIDSVMLNRYYDVGNRDIGLHKLPYTGVSGGPFEAGETVTGGTSSATGVVLKDITGVGGAGELFIHQITGTFEDAESLTGGVSMASATVATTGLTTEANGTVFDTTEALVQVGATVYVKTTDYVVDNRTGRVKIVEVNDPYAIQEEDTVSITVSARAQSYKVLEGFTRTSVEGFLRFVGDVPEGTNLELKIWKVNLTPTGDTAMIGEDWSTLDFEGEILRDEANHPDNPYMDIIATDKL